MTIDDQSPGTGAAAPATAIVCQVLRQEQSGNVAATFNCHQMEERRQMVAEQEPEAANCIAAGRSVSDSHRHRGKGGAG